MYDVIIVGARVAGAPTAMLLARRGLKVLLVDRATFPSDTLSTHQVQLPGVARLARWGVLDAVLAAGTPVTRDVRFDQGDAVIAGRYPGYQGVEAMCSPRRTLLDRVLVDAARAHAGRGQGNSRSTKSGDGPVTGIRGAEKGAPAITEQAASVIGRTASTRWWPRRSAPAPTEPRRRGRSRSTPTGRACRPGTAARPGPARYTDGRAAPSVPGRPTTAC
jgi:2-polyprenyl-6-methoxyphenol hydroxylase-like FAD-dependent oxidoreductase